MPPRIPTSAYTSDFRQAFEAETESLLRRRFLWFTGVVGGLRLFMWLVPLGVSLTAAWMGTRRGSGVLESPVWWLGGPIAVLAYVLCSWLARRRRYSLERFLKLTYWVVVLDGLVYLATNYIDPALSLGLIGVMLTHALACGFLPWSPRQAVRPLIPLLGTSLLIGAFAVMFGGTPSRGVTPPPGGPPRVGFSTSTAPFELNVDPSAPPPVTPLPAAEPATFVGPPTPPAPAAAPKGEDGPTFQGLIWRTLFSPLIGVPGVALCWLRQSRRFETYKLRFFQSRYGEVRRELIDARKIHEALFPAPMVDGPVRFTYVYEPMRQIGGDYLYACWTRSSAADGEDRATLSVVLMDVTGHGIPAALTVNRLHGELQRVFAEQPDIGPGEVLRLLNRYVHLTLATHSVYVTALCLRVDPARDVLEYASGGHPPAYLRAVDGTIDELSSTAFVLGACAHADFHPDAAVRRFGPGDALIAYTDGALEARGVDGKMIGIAGMRRLVASGRPDAAEGWAPSILRAVERHRFGPPADDTLVVEVVRPIGLGSAAEVREAASGVAG